MLKPLPPGAQRVPSREPTDDAAAPTAPAASPRPAPAAAEPRPAAGVSLEGTTPGAQGETVRAFGAQVDSGRARETLGTQRDQLLAQIRAMGRFELKTLDELDLTSERRIPSAAEVNECVGRLLAAPELAAENVESGCESRTHVLSQILALRGIPVAKLMLYTSAEEGLPMPRRFRVPELYREARNVSDGWRYHVVNLVFARDDAGEVQPFVVDPARSYTLQPALAWLDTAAPNGAELHLTDASGWAIPKGELERRSPSSAMNASGHILRRARQEFWEEILPAYADDLEWRAQLGELRRGELEAVPRAPLLRRRLSRGLAMMAFAVAHRCQDPIALPGRAERVRDQLFDLANALDAGRPGSEVGRELGAQVGTLLGNSRVGEQLDALRDAVEALYAPGHPDPARYRQALVATDALGRTLVRGE